MHIVNLGWPEEADFSDGGPENGMPGGKKERKMTWLFLPPIERKKETRMVLNGDEDDAKLQIGSHLYWIRRIQNSLELCRLAVRRDSLILYEVLQHDILGISDDDLEDAVRQANGELSVQQEYRISDHIKTKLQILYAP